MKKLSVKNIIDFRKRSDNSKKNFVNGLKTNVSKSKSQGGEHYWRTSLSSIGNAFKLNDLQIIKDKIVVLEEKFDNTKLKTTKDMYKRNIGILKKNENFDLKRFRPSKNLFFIKIPKNITFTIKGLEIQVSPQYIFSYSENDIKEIGAIWLVAKLERYGNDELGIFADVLYQYLKFNFSKNYTVNPKYCFAIDVVEGMNVNYSQIQNGEVSALLTSTIEEIRKLI